MFANHHTHTIYSDGSSQPEEYIKTAIEKGFTILGFTEHSPLPFNNSFSFQKAKKKEYLNLMTELKTRFSGQISIFSGMEMDFIPGMSEDFECVRNEFQCDYLIGSVHLVKPEHFDDLWFTDGPNHEIYDQGLNDFFGGDIRKAVKTYYQQVNRMIETQHFEIIGHFDKIKMHNRDRFFREDETWYKTLVSETLQLIKKRQLIVEVNTRGIYKQRSKTTYPGLEILKLIKEMGIPVMVNSDAHHPAEIDGAFREAFSLLEEAGIKEVACFSGIGWGVENINFSG